MERARMRRFGRVHTATGRRGGGRLIAISVAVLTVCSCTGQATGRTAVVASTSSNNVANSLAADSVPSSSRQLTRATVRTATSRPASTNSAVTTATTPLAGTPTSRTSSSTSSRAAAVDLRTIDWTSISLPYAACDGWQAAPSDGASERTVKLKNGEAFLPDPAGGSSPPFGPNGWALRLSGAPAYGRFSDDLPQLAVLTLFCSPTGDNLSTNTIAVFDGRGGRPRLPGIYRPPGGIAGEAMTVGPGRITIAYRTLNPGDARCCPSGRASGTIGREGDRLVPSWPDGTRWISSITATGPKTSGTAPPSTRPGALLPDGGRRVGWLTGAGTYTGTILAEDKVTDCAGVATAPAVRAWVMQHPCPDGVFRQLITVSLGGRTVAMSRIMPTSPLPPNPNTAPNIYLYAESLGALMRGAGHGGFADLLRAGTRPAGFPAAIPATASFAFNGEDLGIQVCRAWYLSGSTPPKDSALIALEHNLFLARQTG